NLFRASKKICMSQTRRAYGLPHSLAPDAALAKFATIMAIPPQFRSQPPMNFSAKRAEPFHRSQVADVLLMRDG
ncbi:MAG TPA: hypothetical protein VFF88_08775, partial [Methylocella sp.]|nr:hypothetical protein [Methylocella sp.]